MRQGLFQRYNRIGKSMRNTPKHKGELSNTQIFERTGHNMFQNSPEGRRRKFQKDYFKNKSYSIRKATNESTASQTRESTMRPSGMDKIKRNSKIVIQKYKRKNQKTFAKLYEAQKIALPSTSEGNRNNSVQSQSPKSELCGCFIDILKENTSLKWFRSRSKEKSKKKYRFTDTEIIRNNEIENIFHLFDSDGSGTLEINEIEEVLKHMSGDSQEINKESLRLLFQVVDTDNSGSISIDEFKEFLNDREKQREFSKSLRILLCGLGEPEKKMDNISKFLNQTHKINKPLPNFIPSSAASMLKYLKYRTIRKSVYDSISGKFFQTKIKKEGINSERNYASSSMQEPDSILQCIFKDKTKLTSDRDNFLKIFSGYPIGDASLGEDPVAIMKEKHISLHKIRNPKVIQYGRDSFSRSGTKFHLPQRITLRKAKSQYKTSSNMAKEFTCEIFHK
ncbi:unnamed protein product [Moneuplotes crassus]|uniref:EF-hand domain-containing protein n=1 Tax=Euplotes crassus TaxID=5936 RepID=A0AAD1UBH3_EUPCR|nr:unnamed protein product [Moneuplotes crassus]